MAIIDEAKYIYTDLTNNNNKFWDAQLHDDGTVTARWGRVGDAGTTGTWGGGRGYFSKKCSEKEGKGYNRQRTISDTAPVQVVAATSGDLETVALSQIATDNDLVTRLIKRLAAANVHRILESTTMTYDTSSGTFRTPLGVVDAQAISQARRLLVQINDAVQRQAVTGNDFAQTVNSLLMLVPKNIGRVRVAPSDLFGSVAQVQQENDLLDALEASLNAVMGGQGGDRTASTKSDQSKVFGLTLTLIEDGREMDRIRKKYRETAHSYHASSSLDVKCAYAVDIQSMREAFESKGKGVGNVHEYYHGTKVHNVLSILKSGLQVAPPSTASIAGKMFGNGVYFSDQATKSLNYAIGAAPGQSGGWGGDATYMFLADVAMGRTHKARSSGEHRWPLAGTDSTSAIGGQCGGLMNNEYIVYKNHQVNLTRLVEFTKGGK